MSSSSCCCFSLEGALNFTGYIPALSTVTGLIRMLIGTVEMVAGVFFTFILCSQCGSLSTLVNGTKNIIRGTIETIPIIGNVMMIAYDCI